MDSRLTFLHYLNSIKTDGGTRTVSSGAQWLQSRVKGDPERQIRRVVRQENPLRRVEVSGINPPSPDLGRLLLAHANAGASLVVDGADASSWWKGHGLKAARQFQDRGFYTLGAGRILVYKRSEEHTSELQSLRHLV